jgi:hypothetical protein
LRNQPISTATLVALGLIFASTGSWAGVLCPNPLAKLETQKSTTAIPIDGETVTFFYDSKPFAIDIYSAYARQPGSSGNFCIRYEANANPAQEVHKFHWPLADIQMDILKRVSVVTTKPPGRPPVLDDTWVYGFLSSSAKTFAYQKRASVRENSKVHLALNHVPGSLLCTGVLCGRCSCCF